MNECSGVLVEPSEKSDCLIRDSGSGPLFRVCEMRECALALVID